jgi:hypothetical protein
MIPCGYTETPATCCCSSSLQDPSLLQKPPCKNKEKPRSAKKNYDNKQISETNTFTTKMKKLSARKSAPTNEERPETLKRQRRLFSQIAKYLRDLKDHKMFTTHARERETERDRGSRRPTDRGKRHSKPYYPSAVQRTVKTENPNESTPLGGRRWDRNFLRFFEVLISQMLC